MAKTSVLETPISEVPEVRDLKAQLTEAQSELRAAEEELDHLSSILNPPPWSSTNTPPVNELDVLKARQSEPLARMRYLEAKAQVLEFTPRYNAARSEALHRLTEARTRGRLPILRRFADGLEEAARIGNEIRTYDQETVRLGGSDPVHPFGQLLDDPPYRTGDASRVRNLVERLEAQ